jgi:hypothetical protein
MASARLRDAQAIRLSHDCGGRGRKQFRGAWTSPGKVRSRSGDDHDQTHPVRGEG